MNGEQFSFGFALAHLQTSKRVRRAGWNGKGMWLSLVKEWEINTHPSLDHFSWFHPRDKVLSYAPFIIMKTADDKLIPWLASQTDVLAHDWELVD
jgi:hypothetical protein